MQAVRAGCLGPPDAGRAGTGSRQRLAHDRRGRGPRLRPSALARHWLRSGREEQPEGLQCRRGRERKAKAPAVARAMPLTGVLACAPSSPHLHGGDAEPRCPLHSALLLIRQNLRRQRARCPHLRANLHIRNAGASHACANVPHREEQGTSAAPGAAAGSPIGQRRRQRAPQSAPATPRGHLCVRHEKRAHFGFACRGGCCAAVPAHASDQVAPSLARRACSRRLLHRVAVQGRGC
mmetsp:Transcript_16054/g.60719  ORF Transcript_16054/g.60719 Transcript_16054/m.60719 type:complete len:236 (-) Transcript_16054:446-1153(-)